jgi:hypothetical protein
VNLKKNSWRKITTIKLKAPNELPEDNLSSVAFEAWQNQTISFLEQETFHYEFISGKYTEWKAKQDTADGKRISRLDAQDPEKKVIDAKTGAAAEAAKQGELDNLLIKRNAQLTKFLQLIANLCQYSEQSDILTTSTSLSWIWEYLKRHYNIESRGSHLLDVAAINPKPEQQPIVFYKQFRAGIFNNLRKSGDRMMYKAGRQLAEDETMGPTFESIVMMWALEKLDPRLPAKVKKDFGFRMEGDITLIDLQTPVFQAVPGMIGELDEIADMKAINVPTDEPHPSLAASGQRFRRGQSFRGRGQGDHPDHPSQEVLRLAGQVLAVQHAGSASSQGSQSQSTGPIMWGTATSSPNRTRKISWLAASAP